VSQGAFSTIGTDVVIGGADYCYRGGFAYPGKCPVVSEPTDDAPTVPFGTFGIPVSEDLAQTLATGPTVGPSVTPDPVPDVPNPDLPFQGTSWFGGLIKSTKWIGQNLLPASVPFRATLGLLIPGGLLVLLVLWILKKTRR